MRQLPINCQFLVKRFSNWNSKAWYLRTGSGKPSGKPSDPKNPEVLRYCGLPDASRQPRANVEEFGFVSSLNGLVSITPAFGSHSVLMKTSVWALGFASTNACWIKSPLDANVALAAP